MKDGKYEVGDVIAFRVTDTNPTQQKLRGAGAVLASETDGAFIYKQSPFPEDKQAILERIPNPQLMEGEWWKGWTWKRAYCGYEMKDGEVYLMWSGRISEENGLSPRGIRYEDELASRVCKGDCIVLVPPKQSLCPELKAKIERVEAELAELKKQALG